MAKLSLSTFNRYSKILFGGFNLTDKNNSKNVLSFFELSLIDPLRPAGSYSMMLVIDGEKVGEQRLPVKITMKEALRIAGEWLENWQK